MSTKYPLSNGKDTKWVQQFFDGKLALPASPSPSQLAVAANQSEVKRRIQDEFLHERQRILSQRPASSPPSSKPSWPVLNSTRGSEASRRSTKRKVDVIPESEVISDQEDKLPSPATHSPPASIHETYRPERQVASSDSVKLPNVKEAMSFNALLDHLGELATPEDGCSSDSQTILTSEEVEKVTRQFKTLVASIAASEHQLRAHQKGAVQGVPDTPSAVVHLIQNAEAVLTDICGEEVFISSNITENLSAIDLIDTPENTRKFAQTIAIAKSNYFSAFRVRNARRKAFFALMHPFKTIVKEEVVDEAKPPPLKVVYKIKLLSLLERLAQYTNGPSRESTLEYFNVLGNVKGELESNEISFDTLSEYLNHLTQEKNIKARQRFEDSVNYSWKKLGGSPDYSGDVSTKLLLCNAGELFGCEEGRLVSLLPPALPSFLSYSLYREIVMSIQDWLFRSSHASAQDEEVIDTPAILVRAAPSKSVPNEIHREKVPSTKRRSLGNPTVQMDTEVLECSTLERKLRAVNSKHLDVLDQVRSSSRTPAVTPYMMHSRVLLRNLYSRSKSASAVRAPSHPQSNSSENNTQVPYTAGPRLKEGGQRHSTKLMIFNKDMVSIQDSVDQKDLNLSFLRHYMLRKMQNRITKESPYNQVILQKNGLPERKKPLLLTFLHKSKLNTIQQH